MRVMLAWAALCCFGLVPISTSPVSAQPAQGQVRSAPTQYDDAEDGDDRGGAGRLPGAQFERRLGGGAGFVCTATNALHTDKCTASCRRGERADCVDADGGGTPSCSCTKG